MRGRLSACRITKLQPTARGHSSGFRELLEKAGDLAESVYAAQERTSDLMDSLLKGGLAHHEAWELAREEWAFLPSEEDEGDDDGAEDPGP